MLTLDILSSLDSLVTKKILTSYIKLGLFSNNVNLYVNIRLFALLSTLLHVGKNVYPRWWWCS